MAWKKISSQIVFDNFMQIEEQAFEMPDGQIKQFYIKITRPDDRCRSGILRPRPLGLADAKNKSLNV